MDIKGLAERALFDPSWFVKEVIGYELWSKQKQILESVRDNPRTTVRSCNGAGKSFVSASTVAWFLTNHPESIVITTAPTSRQVEEILWQEIARVYAKAKYPLGGRLMKTKWDFGAKWFAIGLSTDEPDRFQGFHAPHILVVMDEACGIEAPIYEAVEAVLTSLSARLLLIGNPTDPDTEFFKTFQSPLYNKIHISAYDTPNFTGELTNVPPGLITKKWAEERRSEWGEESPAFQARILGTFPDISSTAMIPLSWVIKAMLSDLAPKESPHTIGIDVARFGDDETVFVDRKGNKIERISRINKFDTEEIADAAVQFNEDQGRAEIIAVDAVGIGAGVADKLRRRGLPAIDIESGERAYQSSRFNNKRTEMWYRIRELLRLGEIQLPNDDMLSGQLSSPRYSFDTAGRYVLETKADMKKRGLASPNVADAVVYAFAYDGKYHSFLMREEQYAKDKPGTYNSLLKMLMKAGEKADDIWM